MISFPMEATSNVSKYFQKVMKGDEEHSAMETIGQIVKLTNRARSEGLLALEDEAKSIEDPFFRKGIEFAVDGTDPEALKKTLLSEISAMKERHKVGQGWFTQAGVFAPTFGIIGAVFGLMATMAHLDAPAEVGARHRRRVRRDVLGRVPCERALPADGEQAEAAVDDRGRAQDADRRGHHGDPGRCEPPGGRGAAEVARSAG